MSTRVLSIIGVSIVVFLAHFAWAGDLAPAAPAKPAAPKRALVQFRSLEANTSLATALIATVRGTELVPSGTGFVVEVPRPGAASLPMLCSAAHVFNNGEEPQVAVFHRRQGAGDHFDFSSVISVRLDKRPEFFVANRGADVDLACASLEQIAPMLFYRSISPNDFANLDEPYLTPDTPVFFVGYPDGRIDQANFTPITRHGFLGGFPQLDYDGKPEFVLDAQVFPGSSGSPVFVKSKKTFKFLGMVTEVMTKTFKLPASAPAPQAGQQATYTEFLGLGLVRKSTLIKTYVLEAAKHFSQPTGQTAGVKITRAE